LSTANVATVPVDSGLAAQMLELKLQESTHVDDSDEVDIAVQRAGLQELLERLKRAR
jgi:FMN phosphatase YigB (HAD superfamily)